MDQDTAAAADTTETPPTDGHHDTEPAPPDPDETVVDLNELPDDDGEGDDGGTPSEPTGTAPALDVAVKVLAHITDAVEALSSAPEAEARARVSELANDLRTATERLGGDAGVEQTVPATDSIQSEKSEGFASVIASVRSLLERVGKTLDAANLAGVPQPTAKTEAPEAPAPDIAGKLDQVASILQSLGETVKTQQQRLARMEKRFGLPNSAPIGERPTRAEDEADVGWPLDLNRSLDRESVDKAISFHDV